MLSNDQLRAAYDRDGADSSSLESASFVDPALFFNMLFGSDKFEPYVGRLKLAAFASVAAGSHHTPSKVRPLEHYHRCKSQTRDGRFRDLCSRESP